MASSPSKSRPPRWLRDVQALAVPAALLFALWQLHSQGPIFEATRGACLHLFDPGMWEMFVVLLLVVVVPVRIIYALLAHLLPPDTDARPSLGDRFIAASNSRYFLGFVFVAAGLGLALWFGVRILCAGSLVKISAADLAGGHAPRWGRYVEVDGLLDPDRSIETRTVDGDDDHYAPMTDDDGGSTRLVVEFPSWNDIDDSGNVRGILTHRLPARVRPRLGKLPDDVWVLEAGENPADMHGLGLALSIAMLACGVIVLLWQSMIGGGARKRG